MKRLLLLLSLYLISMMMISQETIVYFSVYGRKEIKSYKLNKVNNQLTYLNNTSTSGEPFSLEVNSSGEFMVASMLGNSKASSYTINQSTGDLTHINTVSLPGDACYLALSDNGKYLLSAYFSPGKFAVNPVSSSGTITDTETETINVSGQWDYPHSIRPSGNDNVVFAGQMGANKISQWSFNNETGKLTSLGAASVSTPSSTGPRHLVYHPTLDVVYFSMEVSSQTIACSFDADGIVTSFQTSENLPANYSHSKWTSDIHITPDGKYLYTANRVKENETGKGSITAFAVNASDGQLTKIDTFHTDKVVREFDITPCGKYLIAAGEKSGVAVLYTINSNGSLTKVHNVNVGSQLWWVKSVEIGGSSSTGDEKMMNY